MKTTLFGIRPRASLCACALAAGFGITDSVAQVPARADKIMTIDELRTCTKLERSNKKAAVEILQEQEGFKRDQDAIKAEQAEVNKANEDLRLRSVAVFAERDAVATLMSALSAKAESAKTDAEKADFEAERTRLVEKNRVHREDTERFNKAQQAQRDRVAALNERIDAINQRNITVNDRVEPHQKQVATWNEQCSKRRFREEDEVAIKKELAAGK